MKVDLPTPGGPLMPTRIGAAGGRQDRVEQGVGLEPVILTGRLDEGDGPGQGAPVAVEYLLCEFRHRGRGQAASRRAATSSSTLRAASGMFVPGPNTAATPASCRKS